MAWPRRRGDRWFRGRTRSDPAGRQSGPARRLRDHCLGRKAHTRPRAGPVRRASRGAAAALRAWSDSPRIAPVLEPARADLWEDPAISDQRGGDRASQFDTTPSRPADRLELRDPCSGRRRCHTTGGASRLRVERGPAAARADRLLGRIAGRAGAPTASACSSTCTNRSGRRRNDRMTPTMDPPLGRLDVRLSFVD